MKNLILIAIAFVFVAMAVMACAVLGIGFGTTGDFTGDNDGVQTKNLYCQAAIEAEWNVFGNDIKISQLQCRTDEPFFMADNMAIFATVEDMECSGYLMKDGKVVSTSNVKTFGDLGVSEEVWYKFGISKVPIGAYTVKVSCQGADAEDHATLEESVNVS
jgi:hypothetical protein